jgi:hypothetical protein
MRYIFISLWLALAGCSTKEAPKAPPAAVPTPQSLGALGNNIDKGDSKVASAVTVMIENSDKPPVVQSEGRVALAHLPKPDDEDLKAARDRVAANDPKAYEAEVAKAKAWLVGIEKEWNEAVNQSKKNATELVQARKDLDASNAEVSALKDEIKKVKAESDKSLWTMAGVGLFVIGVLTGAIFGWRVGGSILACAPLAGAVPVILSSEYFAWIIGVTLGIACCLLLWRIFDYIRDKNNEQSK